MRITTITMFGLALGVASIAPGTGAKAQGAEAWTCHLNQSADQREMFLHLQIEQGAGSLVAQGGNSGGVRYAVLSSSSAGLVAAEGETQDSSLTGHILALNRRTGEFRITGFVSVKDTRGQLRLGVCDRN